MFGRGKGNKDRHLRVVKEVKETEIKETGHRGRHRAIDPDESFIHPDVTGETRPNKIREMIRKVEETNQAETDRILRERRSE